MADKNLTLWRRPGFLARRLHQINVALFLEEFQDLRITPVQWGVMTVVAGAPGLGHTEIAAQVGIDRVNAADVLERLEERGLIEQKRNAADRRQKCAYITGAGAQLLKENEHRVRRTHARLLKPLDKDEQKIFLALLLRLVEENNDLSRAPLKADTPA